MKAAFLGFVLVLSALATGCGGDDSGKTLHIADVGWTENTAIAQLTKLL